MCVGGVGASASDVLVAAASASQQSSRRASWLAGWRHSRGSGLGVSGSPSWVVQSPPAPLLCPVAPVQHRLHPACLHSCEATSAHLCLFVGHSLGGALAILAAYDVQQRWPQSRMRVYTFGAPRVGNGAWTSVYNAAVPDTWCLVNHNVGGREPGPGLLPAGNPSPLHAPCPLHSSRSVMGPGPVLPCCACSTTTDH